MTRHDNTAKGPEEGDYAEMTTATITLQVNADLAQACRSAPLNDKSKLRLLLNLWLRELFLRSTSLTALMDEVSDRAQARGHG